jgi:hypothetical protein
MTGILQESSNDSSPWPARPRTDAARAQPRSLTPQSAVPWPGCDASVPTLQRQRITSSDPRTAGASRARSSRASQCLLFPFRSSSMRRIGARQRMGGQCCTVASIVGRGDEMKHLRVRRPTRRGLVQRTDQPSRGSCMDKTAAAGTERVSTIYVRPAPRYVRDLRLHHPA